MRFSNASGKIAKREDSEVKEVKLLGDEARSATGACAYDPGDRSMRQPHHKSFSWNELAA